MIRPIAPPRSASFCCGQWRGLSIPLSTIVQTFGGELIASGDDPLIRAVGALSTAKSGVMSFAMAQADRQEIRECQASALIAHPRWREWIDEVCPKRPTIYSEEPYLYFIKVARQFYAQPVPAKDARHLAQIDSPISSQVVIGAFATIAENVEIGEGSMIGSGVHIGQGTRIGKNVWIYPKVSIYPDTQIGDEVMIHSGTVIGADGFGFQPQMAQGLRQWVKVPQMARVVIGDEVEIGANCMIDRGALADTEIGKACKIDNGVHIAHGAKIGARTLIMAQVGISGSVVIGEDCLLAGQVGIAPGVKIAKGVSVHGKTVVFHNIDHAGEYSGSYPLQEHRQWLRTQARIKRLKQD